MMPITIRAPKGIAKLKSFFCGCGDPESVWELVKAELERCDYNHNEQDINKWKDYPELDLRDRGYHWLLMYVLDKAGLTDHGGNVSTAWLQQDGDDALEFLNQWGTDWSETKGKMFEDENGVVIGGDYLSLFRET